jgi:CRP/FNR family transcriptional regulator, cyclic AMP receptor protein
METVRFKAGDTILSANDIGDTAFLIVSGSVAVTIGAGHNAKTVGTFGVGEVFGEMSLIEPGKRTATVKALTDTECVETTYEQFVASIEQNPQAALAFMKTLVRRIRHMNELMATMDPGKRSLRQMVGEWRKTADPAEFPGRDETEHERFELMSQLQRMF